METLAESLTRLADYAGFSASALQHIAHNTGTGAVQTDPREEVIIGWGIGLGTLRKDNKGITFLVDMYTLDGKPNGSLIVSSETTVTGPADLLNPPPMPEVIPADPDPVERMATQSFGKARWTFPDGSSLTGLGVGNSNVMLLSGDDVMTAESLALTITGGTGRYQNARGLWATNSFVFNPPGASGSLITSQGLLRQKLLHTIRVVRGVDLRPALPAPQLVAGELDRQPAAMTEVVVKPPTRQRVKPAAAVVRV
jgi:hypothetical protein